MMENSNLNYLCLQAGFAAAMFFGTLTCYLVPLKLVVNQRSSSAMRRLNNSETDLTLEASHELEEPHSRFIGNCNCVGAGIFLAICFLGLLPVVKEEFERFFAEAHITGVYYPVSEFTILMGFFMVLFFEEFVLACRYGPKPPVLYLDEVAGEQSERLLEASGVNGQMDDVGLGELSNTGKEIRGAGPVLVKTQGEAHTHSHTHGHSHLPPGGDISLTYFILMFATSVHSIFEGLALGLIKDQAKSIHIFIGIILHECIVAAALGLKAANLVTSFRKNVNFAVMFSATVPIGIVAGVAMGYTPGTTGRLTSAIFQGLAAGTFLQVAFCELIPGELGEIAAPLPTPSSAAAGGFGHLQSRRMFKIFLIFLGFVLMACLTLLTTEH